MINYTCHLKSSGMAWTPQTTSNSHLKEATPERSSMRLMLDDFEIRSYKMPYNSAGKSLRPQPISITQSSTLIQRKDENIRQCFSIQTVTREDLRNVAAICRVLAPHDSGLRRILDQKPADR